MLFILGSILVGFMLFEALKKDPPTEHVTSSNVSFRVKEGVGVLSLPSCNLIAVQLGPSKDKRKITLLLYLENGDVPHERFKSVSDLRTKKYVKLSPAYYATGITLESNGVPITAYYSSVL